MPNALGLEHAAISQQRIEDAGEATGEGGHGHLFRAHGDRRPGRPVPRHLSTWPRVQAAYETLERLRHLG
jgi:hypothetical protein